MYKFLPIPDFARAGVNSDIIPWDLPPSFLTEINNIRIARKQLMSFGGYSEWADLPVGFEPGLVMPVGATSADFWLIAGIPGVYVYDGTTLEDISSGAYAGITDAKAWNGCMLSRIPIVNNIGDYPEYWSPQSTGINLQSLPWSPGVTWNAANQACRVIRSHKQYLIAMDLVDNGTDIKDGVQWSAPADINGVPATWDFLDDTNVAGRTNLGGDGGDIIDGQSLRDAFCVYQETGISIFDYIANSPFIWQIRNLSTTVGLVSQNSIVEVKGNHFLIGDGDIIVNDGNDLKSLLHNRIRKRFLNNFNPETYLNSYAIKNNIVSEVWFCVPDTGATYPTIAYIYNWRDDSWSIRDIPEGTHANYGAVEISGGNLTWDNIGTTWDISSLTWQEPQSSPLDETIVQCVPVSTEFSVAKLLFLDKQLNAAVGGNLITEQGDNLITEQGDNLVTESDTPSSAAFNSIIERIGFPLGGLNQVTTITEIYPHMTGPGSVLIEIGSQDYPDSPIRWKPGVTFTPGVDRKIDVRTTGELHCFRIGNIGSELRWSLSGIDISYVEAGSR